MAFSADLLIEQSGGLRCAICHSIGRPKYQTRGHSYFACISCDHLFIDPRLSDQFAREFYNSEIYKNLENAWPKQQRLTLFREALKEAEKRLGRELTSVLDFGSGEEDLAEKREISSIVHFFDPYFEQVDSEDFTGRTFDCVVLTEVLEHVFDPVDVLSKVRAFSGLCIATTLLHDVNFTLNYLNPDAGHVSIFSKESMKVAAARAGFDHEIVFWPGQLQYYFHLLRARPEKKKIENKRSKSTTNMREVKKVSFANNPLLDKGARYFSQNDEDGILIEILRRIERSGPATFLELGVDEGLENNTLVLLSYGWRGGWLGAQDLRFEPGSRLSYEKSWIERENVVELAEAALSRLDCKLSDVLVASIDLDGNDYHLLEELLNNGLRPDVFVVEYNAKFPPGVEYVMPYDKDHAWNNDDCFGASLTSWTKLLGAYYRLVCCNSTGSNAFYVKYEYDSRFWDVPRDEWDIFMPGTYQPVPRSGHAPSPKTIAQLTR
jgi:hypothetical protein